MVYSPGTRCGTIACIEDQVEGKEEEKDEEACIMRQRSCILRLTRERCSSSRRSSITNSISNTITNTSRISEDIKEGLLRRA